MQRILLDLEPAFLENAIACGYPTIGFFWADIMAADTLLTGREITFSPDENIVSKTDTKGYITYVNTTFCNVAGYTEEELLGKPHSIIRHPAMPRCVFKLVWDQIMSGREIFGYVVNRARNGDYYWALAHVTPSFDDSGKIIGYHSFRRVPKKEVVQGVIWPLYQDLLKIESSHSNAKEGMNAALATVVGILQGKGVEYDEFILSL
jgi:PAS domain S-box-containing protein